jgi:AraC-like DNA-binding protein
MSDLAPDEFIAFTRTDTAPGVEILEAYNTGSPWVWVSRTYGMAMPTTWSGEALCERRTYSVAPGTVFCSEPGDIFRLARVKRVGSFKALAFEPQALSEYLAEHDIYGEPQWLSHVLTMSAEVAQRLGAVFSAYSSHSTAMHLQTSLTEVAAVIARELVRTRARRPRPLESYGSAAKRIREYLHEEDKPTLDLETLAKNVGMTRFGVVRVFKRQFGVTPYEYQIHLRISKALDLLKQGQSASQVAACCGFSDQSHFIRHFKKRLGTTPGQYINARLARKGRR